MTEREKKYGVILGALLNDIGKFVWQTDSQYENIGYKELSKKFFDDNISSKACIRPIKDYITEILLPESSKKFTSILEANDVFRKSESKSSEEKKIRKPLVSILSRINFEDPSKPTPKKIFAYSPKVLSGYDIFPEEQSSVDFNNWQIDENKLIAEQKALYDIFIEEIALIPDNEITTFVDSLLYLYEKHLSYVNSNIDSRLSDISMYDHAKTIAALSVCKEYADDSNKAFLIIAADVSGIQKFIYSEKEGKSKRLRGRSFYLGLITELFSNYFLKGFDLPRTNILMNGGGHFVMIVPNSEENKKKLLEFEKEIQEWFYNNFKGDLNLVVKSIEADDELYKNFPKWYNEITSLLLIAKKQKNINNLRETFGYELDKMNVDEYETTLTKDQKDDLGKKDNKYEKNMHILLSLFENIGQVLPSTKYIVQIVANKEELEELNRENIGQKLCFLSFQKFGVGYYFTEDIDKFIANKSSKSFDNVTILKINNTEIYNDESKRLLGKIVESNSPISLGYLFMGNYAPIENSKVVEFEELAKMNNEVNGVKLSYPLLATLRMDVDNLGAIFSQGLENSENDGSIRTLSRTVSLSREFNQFFGCYLNSLAKKWGTYITYSGGDDLFIVASWINSIGFALNVKDDFTKFACGNPNVTISGGLFLHKHNYPIGRAAEYAGEAEEKAKHKFENEEKSNDKNCFSVFDREFKWDEFEKYYNYGRELDELVDRENRPIAKEEEIKPSFLHFLLQQSKQMFDKNDEFDVKLYIGLIAKIRYYIARRKVDAKKIKEVENKTTTNRKAFVLSKLVNHSDSEKYLENLIIPASYVVLKNRDNKNKSKKEI